MIDLFFYSFFKEKKSPTQRELNHTSSAIANTVGPAPDIEQPYAPARRACEIH